jgi:hypothetical protein
MLIVTLRSWCCRVVLVVTLKAVMERRNSGKAAVRSKRRYSGLVVRYRVVSGWREGDGEMESGASTALEQSVAKPETTADYRLLLCSVT